MINEDGLISLIKAAPDPNQGKQPLEDDDDIQVIAHESAPVDRSKLLKSELNKAPTSSRPSVPRFSGFGPSICIMDYRQG